MSDILNLIHSLRPRDCRKLIRLGGTGDGGYLVTDDLEGIGYCFSPGVGELYGFEQDLAKRGIESFCIDGSVEHPPILAPLVYFHKIDLGVIDSPTTVSLQTWKRMHLPYRDSILQMDIEGDEYKIIPQAADILREFRIFVVEFHGLSDILISHERLSEHQQIFSILERDFWVAHIHPNNCKPNVEIDGIAVPEVCEFTFYNKNRVMGPPPGYRTDFPHPLDSPNLPNRPDTVLSNIWYGNMGGL